MKFSFSFLFSAHSLYAIIYFKKLVEPSYREKYAYKNPTLFAWITRRPTLIYGKEETIENCFLRPVILRFVE